MLMRHGSALLVYRTLYIRGSKLNPKPNIIFIIPSVLRVIQFRAAAADVVVFLENITVLFLSLLLTRTNGFPPPLTPSPPLPGHIIATAWRV
jgi:hypothetical protein